jgi:L-lactate dehydrogenase complex protein LldE
VKNDLLSAAMVADKAAEVIRTGAEYLVNVDNACLMNIGGRLHREGSAVKTIHLAEILACAAEGDGGVVGGRADDGAAAGDAAGDASAEGRGAR